MTREHIADRPRVGKRFREHFANKPLPESPAGVLSGRMVRRTQSQHKTDDQAYPVRVKFVIPFHDRSRWWGLQDRLHAWLKELGPRRHAIHSGGWSMGRQAMAIYFRNLEDAQACVAAFPELELADGVGAPRCYAPAVEAKAT
jgi:hypothetical protein